MNCCWPAADPEIANMRNTLNLPEPALKFVLLQRTGLQKLRLRLLTKLGVPYFPRICNLEARWRRDAITKGFLASFDEDFDDIQTILPTTPLHLFDLA